MRHLLRLSIILVVFALASLPPLLKVEAQGTQCFGLADADCKILKAADANISNETSFQHDSDFTFSITGYGSKQTVTLKGTGLFALDPVPTDFSDLNAALSGLQLTLEMKGSSTQGTSTQKIDTHYVIIDGNVYTKTIDSDTWDSQLLSDILDQLQGTGTQSSDPNVALVQKIINNPKVQKAIVSIPNIKNLFKIQKTSNAPTVDGQKQIEFLYTYNIKTLITAKEMYPVIGAIAAAGGASGNFTDSQLAAAAQLLAGAFNGSTLKIARWVGSKDKIYHALTVDFLMKFDPSAMGASGGNIKSFTIQIHYQVRLSKVGEPVSITAPEDSAPPTETPKPTVRPTRTPKVTSTLKPKPTSTKSSSNPTPTRTPTTAS